MLVLDRVDKTYPNGVHALHCISLKVAPGEILVVIGGSGCGKSTMLRAICGLEAPSQGGRARRLDHHLAARADRHHLPGAPPAAVAARRRQCRLRPRASPAGERRARVAGALERVGLADKARMSRFLGGRRNASPRRALRRTRRFCCSTSRSPRFDAFTRADLQDHLLDLWADVRPTLIMVTHDVEEAVVLADRIMVMRPCPGRVYEEIPCDLPRPRTADGGLRLRQAPRAGGARPLPRPRGDHPRRRNRAAAGGGLWW